MKKQKTATVNNLNAPAEIKIPYTPAVDELANSQYLVVWHMDANGKPVQIKKAEYDAAQQDMVFTAMVKMGFVNGRGNVSLSPAGTTTRAEAAQVMYKIFLLYPLDI